MCVRNDAETENWRQARKDRQADEIDDTALQRKIARSVANAFRVPERELCARTRRQARTAFARQVAMYLAHVGCGLSYSEVGRLFGRDRTTAAYACKLIEDRRDDPDFDLSVEKLEQVVRRLAGCRLARGRISQCMP